MDGNDELDSDGEEFDDAEDPHDDLRDYAYALVSSNPLRKMMSGRRWKKERVEEVRGRDSNYQDYFFISVAWSIFLRVTKGSPSALLSAAA